MKKLTLLLTLIALTFGGQAYSQEKSIDNFLQKVDNKIRLNLNDVREYQIGPAFTIGNEKDGYFLVMNYDFNKNGIMDVQAEYPITDKEYGIPMSSQYASKVIIDKNEDLRVDKVYLDEDKDGFLEKELFNE